MENILDRGIPQAEISPLKIPFDAAISSQKDERSTHPQNEDVAFFNQKDGSFGVFDGAGGMANGADSSNFCSNLIQEKLKTVPKNCSLDEAKQHLERISFEVQQSFLENKTSSGLGGSTGTFGIFRQTETGGYQAVIANIGDSRAYLYQPDNNSLTKITTDQNAVEYYYGKNGLDEVNRIQGILDEVTTLNDLDPKLFPLHQRRREITNYFGIDEPSFPFKSEIYTIDLHQKDILLLSTDGIHDNLTTTEIKQDLSDNIYQSATDISERLVRHAAIRSQKKEFRSKQDDKTALIIKIGDTPKENDQSQSSYPESLPAEFIPQVGQEIVLQRSRMSGGQIDGGWKIYQIDPHTNELVVHKKIDETNISIKRVKFDDVDRFNRQAKPEDVSTSKNFTQLFFTLDKLGGLQGSTTFFPKDELIKLINQYRKKEIVLTDITRTNNLRNTVEKLVKEKG